MAVNQVSLFFYAPRWQQRLTSHPTAQTDMGAPVQIADAVPVVDADAAPVQPEAAVRWLTAQGFTPVDWGRGRVFERGRVRSIFGPEQDIIAHINGEADEVTDLYVRFTLPRPGPPAVAEWAAFASALCARFALRLAPDGAEPCSEDEVLAAIRGHRFYREFAASFDWGSQDAEPRAAAT